MDRGSILLIVYVAFSEGVTHGIWHQLDATQFATLLLLDAALLGVVLLATSAGSKALGLRRADQITIVFCGSKKSLASGLPMASVLFAGQSLGLVGAAADAVPSDPAHGLRRPGAPLCGTAGLRRAQTVGQSPVLAQLRGFAGLKRRRRGAALADPRSSETEYYRCAVLFPNAQT